MNRLFPHIVASCFSVSRSLVFFPLVAGVFFSSCIKDEPLNSECDIEVAYVHVDEPSRVFFNVADTLVNVLYSEDYIRFRVRRGADLTRMAPKFRITEGATVEPAIGSVHDFSNGPVTYTVTSQDRKWKRQYYVLFEEYTTTVSDTIKFDFENYRIKSSSERYYLWTENAGDTTASAGWDSGNGGFWMVKSKSEPDQYPTAVLDEGVSGKGVRLTTRDTGPLGLIKNMPLAAGNLFLGSFDVRMALLDAMKATRFGIPFDKQPTSIEGYYKYKSGENFQLRDLQIVPGRVDQGTIYAVLYRNTDGEGNPIVLYGDNVQTSPNVVALAKVHEIAETEQWTRFKADFIYNEPIDPDLLANYGYNFTLVFSSSVGGDDFEGAIGSTLCIDEVRVVCLKEM